VEVKNVECLAIWEITGAECSIRSQEPSWSGERLRCTPLSVSWVLCISARQRISTRQREGLRSCKSFLRMLAVTRTHSEAERIGLSGDASEHRYPGERECHPAQSAAETVARAAGFCKHELCTLMQAPAPPWDQEALSSGFRAQRRVGIFVCKKPQSVRRLRLERPACRASGRRGRGSVRWTPTLTIRPRNVKAKCCDSG